MFGMKYGSETSLRGPVQDVMAMSHEWLDPSRVLRPISCRAQPTVWKQAVSQYVAAWHSETEADLSIDFLLGLLFLTFKKGQEVA